MPHSSNVTPPDEVAGEAGLEPRSSSALRRVCGLPCLSGWYVSYARKNASISSRRMRPFVPSATGIRNGMRKSRCGAICWM